MERKHLKPEFTAVHPAFPVSQSLIHTELNGLTKREYIAAALLSGLLASKKTRTSDKTFAKLAREAIEHADELLRQLMKAAP